MSAAPRALYAAAVSKQDEPAPRDSAPRAVDEDAAGRASAALTTSSSSLSAAIVSVAGSSPGSASAPSEPSAPRAPDPATAQGAAKASSRGARRRGASIGRYLVLDLLGQGAVGEVYAAYDPQLDRRVAVKLLRTAWASEDARQRLVREARALAKVSSSHVVQVYDAGEHKGNVFVAMELIEGQSLKQWLQRDPRPSYLEVLRAYLDAARGLLAAHAQGLIHRDIKPANLLMGHDGQVRVADFGLVTREGGEDAPAPGEPSGGEPPRRAPSLLPPDSVEERLTMTGALLGTPVYMAPEQYSSASVGPAADQYSLCVALFEALYGMLPFALDDSEDSEPVILQIMRSKQQGAIRPPPPGSAVPGWVFTALRRGMSVRPEERYPSMAALIAVLSADPRARWRTRVSWLGASAAVTLLAAVALGGWVRRGAREDPCGGVPRELDGVWDEGVKGRVRAAFLGTGRSYAEDTVTRVGALLDRYAADWTTMRAEVCEASRADPPRREILGLRDACLERRRGQLQALTSLLTDKPDPQVLDKAVPAAAGLYPLAFCADTEALTARVRPPEDPALRARVAALQPQVDRLEALYVARKHKDGLSLGEPLLGEAAAMPYAPLRAQIQYWMGRLREGAGDYEGAKALLRAAAVSAAEGRDDELGANAWAWLLLVVGERQQRFEEAAVIRALGPTAVARAQDARTQATWLGAEGALLSQMGKYAEANDLFERALALKEKALGPDHPDVAASLNNLGMMHRHLGDHPRAKATHERALALQDKALGPDHPDVAGSLTNLGMVLCDLGDYPKALATFERAHGLLEKALGPDHPYVATSLNNLAHALYSMGNYPEAKVWEERALAVWEKALGPDHPDVAFSLYNLGSVLFSMGDEPRARAMFERALAVWEKALGPDHPDVADALVGLGRARVRLGQFAAALPLLERALALREKAQGAKHPDLAGPLLGLGELHLTRKKADKALPLLERALALHNAGLKTETELTLADALWQVGKDRLRARALAEEAQAAYTRIGHRPGLARATTWLAAHVFGPGEQRPPPLASAAPR